MFHGISSCFSGSSQNPIEPISSGQKAAILADVFFSTLAIAGVAYALLSLNGVNLGPLNSISSILGGQSGLKILLASGGGFLGAELLATAITSCRRVNVLLEMNRKLAEKQPVALAMSEELPDTPTKGELEKLKGEVANLKIEAAELKQRPTQEAVQTLTGQNDDLRRQLEEKKDFISPDLHRQGLEEATQEGTRVAQLELEEKERLFGERLKVLQDENTRLSTQLEGKTREFDSEKRKLEAKIAELEGSISDHLRIRGELKEQVNSEQKKNRGFEEQIRQLNETIIQQKQELERLTEEKRSLEELLNKSTFESKGFGEEHAQRIAEELERYEQNRTGDTPQMSRRKTDSEEKTEETKTSRLFKECCKLLNRFYPLRSQELTASAFERSAIHVPRGEEEEKKETEIFIKTQKDVIDSLAEQLSSTEDLGDQEVLRLAEATLGWTILTESLIELSRKAAPPPPVSFAQSDKAENLPDETESLLTSVREQKSDLQRLIEERKQSLKAVEQEAPKTEDKSALKGKALEMMRATQKMAEELKEEFEQDWESAPTEANAQSSMEVDPNVKNQFMGTPIQYNIPVMKPSEFMDLIHAKSAALQGQQGHTQLLDTLFRRREKLIGAHDLQPEEDDDTY